MMRALAVSLPAVALLLGSPLANPGSLGQAPGAIGPNPLEESFVLGGVGERIDGYLESSIPIGFSGAALVYRGGLIHLHEAYGLADREAGRPCSVGTLFPAGTLERQFLAAALFRLEEDGRLVIDDELRATLDNGGSDRALSTAIEEADGRPVRVHLRDAIFRPAGMRRTGFLGDADLPDSLIARGRSGSSRAYRILGTFPWLRGILSPTLRADASRTRRVLPSTPTAETEGSIGVLTTAGDLFRWELALQRDGLLGTEARRKLSEWRRRGVTERGDELRFDGRSEGYTCAVLRNDHKQLIVVLATNNDLGLVHPVLAGIKTSLSGGSDTWLTFTVFAISVSALLLVLGVTQRGKRRRRSGRSRPNLFPW